MTEPKEDDLKVWWIAQIPMQPFEAPVPSVEEAARLMNVLAEYDAYQFLHKVKPDYANAGGLMVYESGEWVDWQDPDTGNDDPSEPFPQPSLGWCEKLS